MSANIFTQGNMLDDFLNETGADAPVTNLFGVQETAPAPAPQEPQPQTVTAPAPVEVPPPVDPVAPAPVITPVTQAPQPSAQVIPMQQSLPAEPAAQPNPKANAEAEDPFAAALKQAQAKSQDRQLEVFAGKPPKFVYGKAQDPIEDKDITFEGLREQYEADFPELSDSKKVSWTVVYGKSTKYISNPGSDKVFDVKQEIEKSKKFLEDVKKGKTDAEKDPECQIKPRVTAQTKGEARARAYKHYTASMGEAGASQKPIVIIPSRDGKIYEMRKTPVGTFTAPAVHLPEFPLVGTGFEMALPKIPLHVLLLIENFFRTLSDRYQAEALVHILYDTFRDKYVIKVPRQELSHVNVRSFLEEEYPEHLIHVMDVHSHNTMPAKFSPIDDRDDKATRLYAVIGCLYQLHPELTVRASCAGKFIPLMPEEVFETQANAYPYPMEWEDRIVVTQEPKLELPAPKLPYSISAFPRGEEDGR